MAAETIVSRDVQQYNETIPLDHISISGNNPREKVEVEELKQDLAANGLINPVLVRPVGNPDSSRYEIVCGHRRLEAAKQLGWPSIRCTVRSMADEEAYDLMGVENIQRHNLTPIEELVWLSKAVKNAEARGEKQGEFAKRLGKTQSWISNKLRILSAPEEVLDLYSKGKIGDKHVLTLLTYRQYKGLFDELMEELGNELEENDTVAVSRIEEDAIHLIRWGGDEDYALCLEPFPYEHRDLQPRFNADGKCPGRECDRVKFVDIDGESRPFCMDKECWSKRLEAARLLAANDRPAKAETAEGKVQKCHVAVCTNDTLPGKFWCEEHMDPMKRMAAPPNPEPDLEVAFAQGQEAGRKEIEDMKEWTWAMVASHVVGLEDLIKKEEMNQNQDKRRQEYIALVKGQLQVVKEWNDARRDEQVDLPVKVEGPAPRFCRCKICQAELPADDKAQMVRDMIEHLLDNKGKERHNRAVQKFVSALLSGEPLDQLQRYFEMPKEEAPDVYFECPPKDRGATAKSVEQARAILECEKCRNKKCAGPQEAN